ncbi:MAG: tetratricopeptide repeat protein [Candidatus Gastranaerophilales bacterium]|nr:tetratricopeptide repeat protein [Candidatus Gastranaerophilales bacterium]
MTNKRTYSFLILFAFILKLTCFGGFAFANYNDTNLNARITSEKFLQNQNEYILEINGDFLDETNLNSLYLYDYDFKSSNFYRSDIVDEYNSAKTNLPIAENKNFSNTKSNIYNIKLSPNKTAKVEQRNIAINDLSKIAEAKKLIFDGYFGKATEILNIEAENQNNSWVIAEIAGCFEKMQKYYRAIELYERAISANPDRIELLYSYSLCLYKTNNLAKAENNLTKIISINPDFMLAYYNLGSIYFKKSDYYRALRLFNTSTKLNPLSADAFYNTATILEILNYKTLAYKYYQKSLNLKPDDIYSIKALQRLGNA